jgi:signal transduction histidine kinase
VKELSLNILDIAQNSIRAEASLIEILIDETETVMTITIRDNGYGMSQEFLKTVVDPFSTTRTTRKVGMGIPLLKLAAEQTGGKLSIQSVERSVDPEHCGTEISATFDKTHLDFTPLGDVVSTITLLIRGSEKTDFLFRHTMPDRTVELDTREVRQVLGDDVPLDEYEVLAWIRDMLTEQYASEAS